MNLLDKSQFQLITEAIISHGYENEILWSRNIKQCDNENIFANEAIWVILNSGMKNQVAQLIWDRIKIAWGNGEATISAFKHKGKVNAIDYIISNKKRLFDEYNLSSDKIEYLKSIPWIGNITCWHLAKNLGLNVVKPDRWLMRVASSHNTTPDNLCNDISITTGESKHTIDLIIWRACNLGIIKI